MVAVEVSFRIPVEDGEGDKFCGDFRYDEAIIVAPTEEQGT
jgi:hypothetical protein